ncbi:MAG: Asp23/Gls24 family envelope stress response protein [Sporolactobacillus sp.]
MPDIESQSNASSNRREDLGKIEISPTVIEIIAAIAASEVDGIGDRRGHFSSETAEKIGSRKLRRNVKVDLADEGMVINLYLTFRFGTSIPKVAEAVQRHVVQTLHNMTALDAPRVNVHVVGVRFNEKGDEEHLFE